MHAAGGGTTYRAIDGLAAFGGQIKETMQNWRDNLQAELAGYRERVCAVRFAPGEGGLNLRVEAPAIMTLMQRGHRAGELLADALPMSVPPDPPTRQWSMHCLTRFGILMALLKPVMRVVPKA